MKSSLLTAGLLAMLTAGLATAHPALAASPKADAHAAVAATAATPGKDVSVEQFRAQQKDQRAKLGQQQKEERDRLKEAQKEQRQKLKTEQRDQWLAYRQQRADATSADKSDSRSSRR